MNTPIQPQIPMTQPKMILAIVLVLGVNPFLVVDKESEELIVFCSVGLLLDPVRLVGMEDWSASRESGELGVTKDVVNIDPVNEVFGILEKKLMLSLVKLALVMLAWIAF